MRDNGIIDELQDKWFGFKMPIPSDGYLPEGAYKFKYSIVKDCLKEI